MAVYGLSRQPCSKEHFMVPHRQLHCCIMGYMWGLSVL
jgi:hypothetical protein